jgi:hypothetical protein
MGAPKYLRLAADFEEWFPEGLYLVGEIVPVTEYQSQEDPARSRPIRPVVLEGMTVRPHAEVSGQAKWITWVIRATGMTAPSAAKSPGRQADTSKAA